MSLKNVNKAVISGNTYPYRSEILEIGGRWDPIRKGWVIDIKSHPMNTMRKRSALQQKIDSFGDKGCQVEYL